MVETHRTMGNAAMANENAIETEIYYRTDGSDGGADHPALLAHRRRVNVNVNAIANGFLIDSWRITTVGAFLYLLRDSLLIRLVIGWWLKLVMVLLVFVSVAIITEVDVLVQKGWYLPSTGTATTSANANNSNSRSTAITDWKLLGYRRCSRRQHSSRAPDSATVGGIDAVGPDYGRHQLGQERWRCLR
uniref:Uncharacterized protein n=1 Tax=Anopheles atroparvus TaxID=41427 RepID=A0A182IZZ1_ANOAO